MTEPQVWTMMAVFAAAMFSVIGLVLRTMKAESGATRAEIRRVDERITSLHNETVTRFEAVNQRFEAVNQRFDALDRDVGALAQRVFHQPE